MNSIEIRDSDELVKNLLNPRTEWLQMDSGDYYLDELTLPVSKWLRGFGPLQTRLHLRGNLRPSILSKFQDFTLISEPGSVVCDNASFSHFKEVTFQSDLPLQNHVGVMSWRQINSKNSAIVVSPEANPDNAYKLRFEECGFNFLEYGIQIFPPSDRAITSWYLNNCEFNGCKQAVWGNWITQWYVFLGNVQLSKTAYYVAGTRNCFVWNHIERSAEHFKILGEDNVIFMVDARKDKVFDLGVNTLITYRGHKNPGTKVEL